MALRVSRGILLILTTACHTDLDTLLVRTDSHLDDSIDLVSQCRQGKAPTQDRSFNAVLH